MSKEKIEFRLNHFIDTVFNTEEAALAKIKEKNPGIEEWTQRGIYYESNTFNPIGYSGEKFNLLVEFSNASQTRVTVLDAFISKDAPTIETKSTKSIQIPIVKYTLGRYSVYNTHMEVCKPVLEPQVYNDKGIKTRRFTVLFQGCEPRVYFLKSKILTGNDKRDEVARMASHDLIKDRLFLNKTGELQLHKYLGEIENQFGPFAETKDFILKVKELETLKKSYLPPELYDEDGVFKLDFDEVSEDGSKEAYASLYKIETPPN